MGQILGKIVLQSIVLYCIQIVLPLHTDLITAWVTDLLPANGNRLPSAAASLLCCTFALSHGPPASKGRPPTVCCAPPVLCCATVLCCAAARATREAGGGDGGGGRGRQTREAGGEVSRLKQNTSTASVRSKQVNTSCYKRRVDEETKIYRCPWTKGR